MKNQNVVSIPGLEEPEKESKYGYAEEAHEIAARVIDKWHSNLAECKIVYLFKDVRSWESKGKTVFAKTYKAPEQWQYLSGYDIVVIVNLKAWGPMNIKQKEALIDHELCHVDKEIGKNGEPKYSLVTHDVEEFAAVIRRHGLWTKDAQTFFTAAQQMTIKIKELD